MTNDSMTAVGMVRVLKKSIETGEVVYDKTHKNQITNFARQQAANLWTGLFVPTPTKIAVGNGTSSSGTSPNDTALWNEIVGSRVGVDYAATFLNYYSQFSVTYDNTEILNKMSSFSDSLTAYSGSSATGWTNSGTLSFGVSGATATGGAASIRSTTCTQMDPNADGSVVVQVTFKIPTSTISSDYIHLYQDVQNFYEIYLVGAKVSIGKTVGNVHTSLASCTNSLTWTAGASYTLVATIDQNGVVTGTVYSGTTATGTPLATVTYTDATLPGPYAIQIGGDSGVVMSSVRATYPNPDSTKQISITEAGLFDNNGNLWSHVPLSGVTHDNTTTLSIQWQILQQGN